MRKLFPLAVLLLTAGVRADEPVRAPVPKATPAPSIEGRYVGVLTELQPGFGGGPAGAGKPALRRSVGQRGEVTVTKDTIAAPGGDYAMTYALDTTKTPMTIDVETHLLGEKPTKQVGVVEVSGSRLTIALAKEGSERPKSVEEAEGVIVYYFQKAPPPPRAEYRIVALRVGAEEKAEKELNDLAKDGFEVVSTSSIGVTGATAPTITHIVLKRVVK